MTSLRRRTLLALVAGTGTAGLAGCGDVEAEFLVTRVQRIHRPGDDRFDYPEDILYRITIENTGPRREEGTLEMTLTYDPPDGSGETWEQTDEISLSRGTSMHPEYVFENVFVRGRDIEDYTLEAAIDSEE